MSNATPTISDAQKETCPRTFFFLPTLDFYIFREFMIPFSILLFAFTFLFLIGDVFNDLSDLLEHKASLQLSARYFLLKMPGNIRFVLPISVLLACMYTLANFGRLLRLWGVVLLGNLAGTLLVAWVMLELPIFDSKTDVAFLEVGRKVMKNDISQMFADPQVAARGMRMDLDDGHGNRLPSVRAPMVMSATPLAYDRPSPRLGEHTAEILAELEEPAK